VGLEIEPTTCNHKYNSVTDKAPNQTEQCLMWNDVFKTGMTSRTGGSLVFAQKW